MFRCVPSIRLSPSCGPEIKQYRPGYHVTCVYLSDNGAPSARLLLLQLGGQPCTEGSISSLFLALWLVGQSGSTMSRSEEQGWTGTGDTERESREKMVAFLMVAENQGRPKSPNSLPWPPIRPLPSHTYSLFRYRCILLWERKNIRASSL